MFGSIFLDFNLPNAATWFYFSLLLMAGLFLKFTRLLSLRNWDILTLYLLVPGFLLLQEAHALLYTVANGPGESTEKTRLLSTATSCCFSVMCGLSRVRVTGSSGVFSIWPSKGVPQLLPT